MALDKLGPSHLRGNQCVAKGLQNQRVMQPQGRSNVYVSCLAKQYSIER